MASYTFFCKTCGEFTEWHTSTNGNKQEMECPDCHVIARRMYKPPITFRMDSRVKNRIMRGMEPRVVKKEDLPTNPYMRTQTSRPWQTGH